jgi:preprotein translocase subunit SecF
MMFKGIDFWPHGIKLPVMDWRWICVGLSTVLALASVVLVLTKGFNLGVDFKGGSLIEVQSAKGEVDVGNLRDRISRLNLGEVQVQGADNNTALIRVAQVSGGEDAQQAAARKLADAIKDVVTIRRVEVVGPAVSSELARTSFWAVVVSLLGILAYVWFRFEWQFAVAAITALVHDVLITCGVFSMFNLDFDLTIVAALLTLAGYSINDTVVVFDRIRENLRKFKKMPLIDLMNLSINETLSRTVLTASTVFFAVLALYLFGTEAIQGFAFCMLFGVIIGTWSSVFVAAPLLLWLGLDRDKITAAPAAPGEEAKAASRAKA